jgi:hypothetical protein
LSSSTWGASVKFMHSVLDARRRRVRALLHSMGCSAREHTLPTAELNRPQNGLSSCTTRLGCAVLRFPARLLNTADHQQPARILAFPTGLSRAKVKKWFVEGDHLLLGCVCNGLQAQPAAGRYLELALGPGRGSAPTTLWGRDLFTRPPGVGGAPCGAPNMWEDVLMPFPRAKAPVRPPRGP